MKKRETEIIGKEEIPALTRLSEHLPMFTAYESFMHKGAHCKIIHN